MKIENNRALAAEKKTYEIPSVVLTQLMPSTIVLAGSPGGGADPGLNVGGDPIPSGGGGD